MTTQREPREVNQKMVTPYITQEHFDKAFPEQAAVEPIAWATSWDIENVTTGFSKDIPCRAMAVKPSFPKEQVVYVYTMPPDTQAAMRAALDALIVIRDYYAPDGVSGIVDDAIDQLRTQLRKQG